MPPKSAICDAYGHHWCNCPEAEMLEGAEMLDGLGCWMAEGASRGGTRAFGQEVGLSRLEGIGRPVEARCRVRIGGRY
jgi:hypothetical protein